jgi:hypothetical protein
MNNSIRSLLLGLLIGGTTSALAQDSQEAPAPIITVPAPQMEWTMKLDSGDNAQKAPLPRLWDAVSWAYTRSGNLTRIVVTYQQDGTREYWRFSHITLCQNVKLHKIDVRPDTQLPAYPCASDGFYGLQNVKPADDQGVKSFEGTSFHYFRGSYVPKSPRIRGSAPPSGSAVVYQPSYEAWFDLKTGLPKAYREGNRTFLYEFSSSVPGPLQLPPEWKAALAQYADNLRKAGLSPGL